RFDYLSARLAADPQITVDNAKRYATDTEVPNGRASVHMLREMAGTPGVAADVKQAADILGAWNGRADVDSVGAGLYLYWFMAAPEIPDLTRKAQFNARWSASESKIALDALQSAAAAIMKDHGKLDVPW